MTLASTEQILAEMRAGRMTILIDEEDRENEGDLLLPADCIDAQAINFMTQYARGLVCLTLTSEHCAQLNLPLMVSHNNSVYGTNFTLSIEAAQGVTTGISAADRAHTIQVAAARHAQPQDIVQPGHIFPLRAQPGGVLTRAGHTEAGCDLAKMAGYTPAAVICEIMNKDGTMARLPELLQFGEEHGLLIGTIADLIRYRSRTEKLIERVYERPLQTPWGLFQTIAYRDYANGNMHLALTLDHPHTAAETWVGIHESLSILDILDETGSAPEWRIAETLKCFTQKKQSSALILLNCADTKHDLLHQLMFETSSPSAPMPKNNMFNEGLAAQILKDLGVTKIRLLGTSGKNAALTDYGLEITAYQMPQR